MKWFSPAFIAAFMFLFPSPSVAGYVADVQPIGFSPDGKVFAFEQYFIEPENGASFVTIFMIDTEKDTYIPGTPVKESGSETVSLGEVRAKAAAKAKPLLDKYKLRDDPGHLVAFAPVTEIDASENSLRYYANPHLPPVGDSFSLKLEHVDLPVTEDCKVYDTVDIGFRLLLTESHGTPTSTLIHEDKEVPKARNCPNGYRLGAIVTSDLHQSLHIALVQVNTFGFEGSNATWIAVPVPVTANP